MKNILFFACLFCCSGAIAQCTLKGNVTDSSGQALYPATVTIFRLPDTVKVRQSLSKKEGFRIVVPSPGEYGVAISHIGYYDYFLPVHIGKADNELPLGRIQLAKKDGSLLEVVVRASIPPVIVKRDTIAYNTSAYKTRPNATVEDLLRKLPGIEVDADGTITMQGQKVEKIYIDGKELFLNDPKIASQNLRADMVQSVEAFDASSDKSRLTGIKSPNGNKAMNLKLKKDRKHSLFGELYAGAGTAGSWSAGGTATRFIGDQMLFGSAGSNNINNLFIGYDRKGAQILPGSQTSNTQSLNYRDNWGKPATATINFTGNEKNAKLSGSSARQTFLGDSILLQNTGNTSSNSTGNQNLSAKIEANPDSLNSIVYTPSFTLQRNSSASRDTTGIRVQKAAGAYAANTGSTDNTSNGNGYAIGNDIAYIRRFQKKNRSFYAAFTEGHNQQDQNSSLSSLVNYFDSAGGLAQQAKTDQRARQHEGADNYGLNLVYSEPLSRGHALDFDYGLTSSKSSSSRNSFDFDSLTNKFDLPDTLTSNHFRATSTTHRATAGYNVYSRKFSYQVGIAAQFSELKNNNLTSGSTLVQHFTDWFPKASAGFELAKGKDIGFQYNVSSKSPTVDQLQPVPDLTNPFLVKIGNSSLKQQFDHIMNLNYYSFSQERLTSLFVHFTGDFSVNKIVPSNITLTSGVQQVQYINVDGAYNINANLSYGIPLSPGGHGNVKFGTIWNYTKDISFVNGAKNIQNGITGTGNLSLSYNVLEKLFIEARAMLGYNATSYSIAAGQATHQFNQHYILDFAYALPLHFHVSADYSLQETGSQGSLPGKQINVLNASLYKNIFKGQQGEIKFSAFDVFNSASSFSAASGPNFIATANSNTLGRVLLLSFIYRFHRFYKAGKVS